MVFSASAEGTEIKCSPQSSQASQANGELREAAKVLVCSWCVLDLR